MNVFPFIAQNHVEVLDLTAEHLWLVGASIFLAVLIGIPLWHPDHALASA